MEILIATGIYPPEIGGPATYTVLLERRLPERGHTVRVLPFAPSRSYPKIFRHTHYFFRVLKAARSTDIVFAQDVASVGLPALLAAKLLHKPFFVRVPGDYAWEQATQRLGVQESIDEFQHKTYGTRVELLRSVQKFVTRHATHVITPSNYFKDLVSGWGVKEGSITTIYNGVDLAIIPADIPKPTVPTLVTAGRLVPWKGFGPLISALKDLPDWQLIILGDGPQRAELESCIKEYGLEDRVQLLGNVTREEVFGWCTVADAFVLNTHFESFSYQIVEAMYSGTPVITTHVGSIPELITSGEEGLLFAPDDTDGMIAAIRQLAQDVSLWNQRTQNAIKKAKTFSVDATMDKLCVLLKKYEA